MKWAVVLLIMSPGDAAAGGTVQLEKTFTSLETCSVEADRIAKDWREAYEDLEKIRKKRRQDLWDSMVAKYGERRMDALEEEARTAGWSDVQIAQNLRTRNELDLAGDVDRMVALRNWNVNRQSRMANAADVVCIPVLN